MLRLGLRQIRRRVFSTDLKEARAARRAKFEAQNSTALWTKTRVGTVAVVGAAGFLIYEINRNPDGQLAKAYHGSWLDSFFKFLYTNTFGHFDEIFEPSSDALIPDWPTAPCYGNVAPGTPAPPLLVIDVEKTLVGSVYDAKHGWRHVKRPGVDKFLQALSQYYEIVLFSENDVGVSGDILNALDPQGACHKLGSNAAEIRGGKVLKRLDRMNRDVGRIILIDDSEESSQLFPRNTLLVKPFTDINDRTDTALTDLLQLLQAFVHDGVNDFRDTIDDLGTHDAYEAVTEYRMRVSDKRMEEERRRNRGLGGLLRGSKISGSSQLGEDEIRSTVLSPGQIVGSAPSGPAVSSSSASFVGTGFTGSHTASLTGNNNNNSNNAPAGPANKKKGKIQEWMENSAKDRDEYEMKKQEKMQEIMRLKYEERMKKQQQQQ